ncbi:hypothetical protein J7J08_08150 [Stenotrophomonas sp. ISL-67]|uniref:hypothetical protein n=1 Tax=Stenotrophomonas sp. ISL-67 TaxID=2819171 RepID=UPI001BE9BFC2|nr:hypothetical protein [Stenotrophomonas sp. ISL-67]MBT2767609.1 hypothetical protein [Stenotrophomonas sp. ISL-67]
MPVPQITITPAGFAAIINAEHTGTAPVKLTHVGLTAQHFDVASVGAAVPGEAKRLTTFAGQAVALDTLHLNVRDDTADAYTLRGFGLYLQDGTLFAVYSQQAPIMEKASAAVMLLATDIRFAKVNATSIEVGDIDFVNPPATNTRAGVVRLATDQEAEAGSNTTISLTPFGLARYINKRFGDGAPSIFVKGLLGMATAALFRTELGLRGAALRDEGHGNGLNADLLDGQHGEYFLQWKNFTGVPTQFTPVQHVHPISEVTGLADALDGKAAQGHSHSIAAIPGLQTSLDGKLNLSGGVMSGQIAFKANPAGQLSWRNAAGTVDRFYTSSSDAEVNFHSVNDAGTYNGTILTLSRTSLAVTAGGSLSAIDYVESQAIDAQFRFGGTAPRSLRLSYNYGSGNAGFYDGTGARWLIRFMPEDAAPVTHFPSGGINVSGTVTATGATINGSLTITGIFNRNTGSSEKLKDIEGPLPYGLDEVRRIRTVIGRYKPDFCDDQSRRPFVVAEQLATVVREAVREDVIDFNGQKVPAVEYELLIPVLINAVSQLADLVDEMRASHHG